MLQFLSEPVTQAQEIWFYDNLDVYNVDMFTFDYNHLPITFIPTLLQKLMA